MARMIQVRNVPDALHRELTRRARQQGKSLTQHIEDILRREAARPTPEEIYERIARSEPVDLGRPAAEIIREERRRSGRDPRR